MKEAVVAVYVFLNLLVSSEELGKMGEFNMLIESSFFYFTEDLEAYWIRGQQLTHILVFDGGDLLILIV